MTHDLVNTCMDIPELLTETEGFLPGVWDTEAARERELTACCLFLIHEGRPVDPAGCAGPFSALFRPLFISHDIYWPRWHGSRRSCFLSTSSGFLQCGGELAGLLGTEKVTMIYSQSRERLSFNTVPSGLGAGLSGRMLAYLCVPDPGFHP